jgi:predicted dehydrogenase
MATYNIAYIGTGGRSLAYSKYYAECQEINTIAIADPAEDHRKIFLKRSNLLDQSVAEYDDWRTMLDNHIEDIDGAVIASPNHLHAEHALPLLERGLPIALEKPMATTPTDCRRILDAEKANQARTLLGFVLRSTPFYTKIHDLISKGLIGKVTAIQADELPGLGVSSVMSRSPWRRHSRYSGGSMLEKSCHDLDILNWMMNCRPQRLSSFGGQRIFNANPTLPDRCDHCPVGNSCQYYKQPDISDHEDRAEGDLHQYIPEDDRCIYNIDKDYADVQSICIEYENGGLVNFLLNFNAMGPRAGRTFHAIGHRGQIWGHLHTATVYSYQNQDDSVTEYDCSGDGSGHGGGDRIHAMQLLRMMKDPNYVPDSNARAGYLSAMMCFASDIARSEGRLVTFHYDGQSISTS